MAWTDWLTVDVVVVGLGNLAAWALAVWLIALDARSPAHRSFAMFLFLWGAGTFPIVIFWNQGVEYTLPSFYILAYAFLALGFPLLQFLAVYPRRTGFFGRHRVGRWVLPGLGLWVVAAFAFDHALMATPRLANASPDYYGGNAALGPLLPFAQLGVAGTGWAAAVLARRARGDREAGGIAWMVLGLGVYAVHRGTEHAVALVRDAGPWPGYAAADGSVYGYLAGALVITALPTGIYGLAALARSSGTPWSTRRGWILGGAFVYATVLGILRGFADQLPFTQAFYFGLGWLPLPLLVTYALVRHHLFDIDLKIKWTLRRGTVAGVLAAVFVVVTAIAEQWLQQYGVVFGGAAVGLMLVMLRPLDRAAGRLADKAMPGVQDTPEYRARRKEEVYRGQLEGLMADGVITQKERMSLLRLQRDLGLSAEHANRIEERLLTP